MQLAVENLKKKKKKIYFLYNLLLHHLFFFHKSTDHASAKNKCHFTRHEALNLRTDLKHARGQVMLIKLKVTLKRVYHGLQNQIILIIWWFVADEGGFSRMPYFEQSALKDQSY